MPEATPIHDPMAVTQRMYARDQRTTDERLSGIEHRQNQLEQGLRANTETTNLIATSTQELLDLMNGFKLGFKALNTLAKVIAPLATVVSAIVGFVVWLKAGK